MKIIWLLLLILLATNVTALTIEEGTEVTPSLSNVTYYFNTVVTATNLSINTTCMIIEGGHFANTYCYSSSANLTYNITDFNVFNLSFYDSDTKTLLNGTNITLTMIGDNPATYSTTTGHLNLADLPQDDYTLLYSTTNYKQGKYVIHAVNSSIYNLSLYLQTANNSNLLLITVQDRFGNPLQDSEVIIQKWVEDSWLTDQILTTDFRGQTEGYYVISTVYYNHVIKYNDVIYFGAINDLDGKKIIYTEDVSNGITFTIDILENGNLEDYLEAYDTSVQLTFTNSSNTTGYFRYFFTSDTVVDKTGKIEVYDSLTDVLVCSDSLTTSTGTLFCPINTSMGSGLYHAVGSINAIPVVEYILPFDENRIHELDFGALGYFIGFFILIIAYFMFIESPTLSLWTGSIAFIGLSMLGIIFQDMGYVAYIAILGLTYMVANIKSESGVNT